MSVALTGTGGFFTRLGAAAGGVNEVNALTGTTLTARLATLTAQYASNEQTDFAPTWTAATAFQSAPSSWLQNYFSVVQNTLIDQVDRDTALPSRTVAAATAELIRQMKVASASLNRPTLGSSVAAGSGNTGDNTIGISTIDGDGLPLDCIFAETLKATVTSDSGSGSTAFSEQIQILGDTAAISSAYNWPLGSGSSNTLTAADPDVDGLIKNGSFQTWTVTNVPDNWTFANSTVAGTHVTKDTTPARTANGDQFSLRLTSDGSTLITLRQATTSALSPLTVYAVTYYAKISAVDASGQLRVALVDVNGNVVSNAQSTANSFTTAMNGGAGIGTSYAQFTAFFQTPAKIPTGGLQLEFKVTTSPAAAKYLTISLAQLVKPTQLYSGGPYAVVWSNLTSPVKGDYWFVTTTNSLGTTSLVRNADRFLSTRQLGLKFPTSGSPTISDALVA